MGTIKAVYLFVFMVIFASVGLYYVYGPMQDQFNEKYKVELKKIG